MRRRIAAWVATVAALAGLASAALLGIGLIDSHLAITAASAPLPSTVIEHAPAPGAADAVPQASWPSNLPAEDIAGLPEYTAVHDSETYKRVQTWIRLCMRDQFGHSYSFEVARAEAVVGFVSMTFIPMAEGYDQHEKLSLYGEPGNLLPDYDWTRGGCYGQALHKAGLLPGSPGSFSSAELAQIDELYSVMDGDYTLEEHLSQE